MKASVTIAEIDERLRHLPPDKLIVVYDFVSYLLERDIALGGDGDHAIVDRRFHHRQERHAAIDDDRERLPDVRGRVVTERLRRR